MSSPEPDFSRVVGHAGPKQFFRGVLSHGRVPPGFLFHGESGRGKKLFATELLSSLFAGGPSLENHPDVELLAPEEGKTTIPIARLRDLKKWFALAPYQADRKAALIADAHCLAVEAQNSLLKLLEEPPRNGLIILVTHEPGALLETIHSRLQSVFFGPVFGADAEQFIAQRLGVGEKEAATALSLSRGAPGAALAWLSDASSRDLMALVPALLGPRPGPFAFADEFFQSSGMRVAAKARQRCRRLFEFAIESLAQDQSPWGLDHDAETIADLLDAKNRLSANVSPRIVVESLKIKIQRRLASKRRRESSP
ncbi:MAG: hypothetical protein V3W41_16705 [Planctomycetota bacterium]